MSLPNHSVEKIGGTSMCDYVSVRDNIILQPVNKGELYQRVFVVSAYGGLTDKLLEHKKNGKPGVYALFANGVNDDSWLTGLLDLKQEMLNINASGQLYL
jgi:aspartate kinase